MAPSMATSPLFCVEESRSGISTNLHSGGHEAVALFLQNDSRQRSRRRSLENGPVLCREVPVMTRAREAVLVLLVIHGAGKVSAFLTEGVVLVFPAPDQNAAIGKSGIREEFHPAYGNFAGLRHGRSRKDGTLCEIRAG